MESMCASEEEEGLATAAECLTLTQRLEARSPPVIKVNEESCRGLHENVKGVEGWKYQTADTAVRSSLPVSRAEKVN